jgi:prepilin-type N-terminal cleavage/methylation domain-containing protein
VKRACHHRRGITLIELLIAVALLSIISTSVFLVWTSAERASREANALAAAQAQARVAMRQLEREVRSGRISSVNEAKLPAELDFCTLLPNGTVDSNVRYFVVDGSLMRAVSSACPAASGSGPSTNVVTGVESFAVNFGTSPGGVVSKRGIEVQLEVGVQNRRARLETYVEFRNP